MMSFKVLHIITDLNGFGGTEATLLRYLKISGLPRYCHRVIVLKSIGSGDTIGAQMVAAGIKVIALEQKRGVISLNGLIRLYREVRAFQPDVISGWLYHPSLLATLLMPLLKCRPSVVWNIRSLTYAKLLKTPGRFLVQRLLAVLSHFSNPVLVSNSKTAMRGHILIGFDDKPSGWTIISNGIDIGKYYPQRDDAIAVRRELGIPVDALIIGCVGRFVPEKGYPIMFASLSLALKQLNPELAKRVHFLAMGNGVSDESPVFRRMAVASMPLDRLHLLGKRADVPRLLRALDIFVLPSISEAFPNALIEAMATGLACIATDVGECREVLSTPNFIVPPNNVLDLARCINTLVSTSAHERATLGEINKQRVGRYYGIDSMVASFDILFEKAAMNASIS
ncbi:MAG: glycosyltransferase [Nitrososphaera sp.]